ncbi:MAG: DNA-3-methyladenine glycosylase I [Crocinitomicaceae bacterium]|nr:DNA-3-methyladenine glycosylase I [Crocinitomicaceae bacterium]
MSYCVYCESEKAKEVHKVYHDQHYGFPIADDDQLFGRLILEINQAGLSWETILNKEQNFVEAYANFNIEKVAAFTENDREILLSNAGIIRNKLKVNAAIHNAQQILEIKQEFGSFKNWLDVNHPLSKDEWTKLFKRTFKFVGGEIVNEFLMSTGYLPGAHDKSCPIFDSIAKLNPKWMEV